MTQFDPSMLPPRPQIIPDELRAMAVDNTGDWQTKVPPAVAGMFVATVAQWLANPRLGLRVNVETREDGWTLDIVLPAPETRDDVILPGA